MVFLLNSLGRKGRDVALLYNGLGQKGSDVALETVRGGRLEMWYYC